MNLKEKLGLIESFSKTFKPVEKSRVKSGIEEFIEGEYLTTPMGQCFVATKKFDGQHFHGTNSIAKSDHITPDILASLGKDEKLLKMKLENTIFFDTETTGLSSGVGTCIFLAGCGYFENDGFVIKQYFLRDFNEELAFLYAINQLLKNFTGIVSYNGKSYDWPLLQTRFIYSRLECELINPLHLDLVHTARRIWKKRLGDCSLENIEQQVLNFRRENDIPGSLIPQTYFEYLRTKNAMPLVQIFHHNILDILSMAALLNKSAYIFKAPIDFLDEHQDLFSLAHTYENMRQWQKSITIYENLLNCSPEKRTKSQIALQLSYCYKRTGKWKQAVQLWKNIIAGDFFSIEPYIELAKYYEHHQRAYKKAADVVEQALNVLEIVEQLRDNSEFSHYKDELNYRLKRINGKLAR